MKKWRWADSLLSGAGCTYPHTLGDGHGDGDAYIRQYWNTHGSDDQPIDERIEKPAIYGPQRHCYAVVE